MRSPIVTADHRQFTKLAAAANLWLLRYAYGDQVVSAKGVATCWSAALVNTTSLCAASVSIIASFCLPVYHLAVAFSLSFAIEFCV